VTAPQARPRRPDESMTLLTEVMTSPLDPGYAAAARRRAERAAERAAQRAAGVDAPEDDDAPSRLARSPVAVGMLLVVGLLLAVAFVQARGSRPAGVAQRDALVAEIQRQSAGVDRLQRANAAALVAIESARGRRLQAQSQGALAEQVTRLGLVTGAVAVAGPGIEVTVNDAANVAHAGDGSNPRGQDTADDGRVLDQDLQVVVNGLWAAGAEAVSINGQRLTALSAIRSAGQAVLVDYRPLAPPYRISAVGDPAGLRSRFSAGPGGRELRFLQKTYAVRASVATADRLTLPASSGVVTRRAKAVELPSANATGTASTDRTAPSDAPASSQEAPLTQDLP
jgi:uncharacterized protein YlxW (UPF0749 family)